MPDVFNHATKPIDGACAPAGTAVRLTWPELEGALRRAGMVRPGESVYSFIAGEEGLYVVTERNG